MKRNTGGSGPEAKGIGLNGIGVRGGVISFKDSISSRLYIMLVDW